MPRYKGRQNIKAIEKAFPHHVDMIVPPGGLGAKLDEMYAWHARHGIEARHGRGSHDAKRTLIRWCFADAALAKTFAAEFSPPG
jgi:hypothetical protein